MLGNEIEFFFILERDLSISFSSAIFLSKKNNGNLQKYFGKIREYLQGFWN